MASEFDEADLVAARIAEVWTDMRRGQTLAEVLTVVGAYQQTRARVATLEAERDRLAKLEREDIRGALLNLAAEYGNAGHSLHVSAAMLDNVFAAIDLGRESDGAPECPLCGGLLSADEDEAGECAHEDCNWLRAATQERTEPDAPQ